MAILKKDLISEKEFNELNQPIKKLHYPIPSDAVPNDENDDSYLETLMGMEYEVEGNESEAFDLEAIPEEDLEYLNKENKENLKANDDKKIEQAQ